MYLFFSTTWFFFIPQALKVMENIDFNKKTMYSRVPQCQITTYYYVGFAYMMMRRYQDAIRTFCNILLYIQRTKQMFQTRTYLYDQVRNVWNILGDIFAVGQVILAAITGTNIYPGALSLNQFTATLFHDWAPVNFIYRHLPVVGDVQEDCWWPLITVEILTSYVSP